METSVSLIEAANGTSVTLKYDFAKLQASGAFIEASPSVELLRMDLQDSAAQHWTADMVGRGYRRTARRSQVVPLINRTRDKGEEQAISAKAAEGKEPMPTPSRASSRNSSQRVVEVLDRISMLPPTLSTASPPPPSDLPPSSDHFQAAATAHRGCRADSRSTVQPCWLTSYSHRLADSSQPLLLTSRQRPSNFSNSSAPRALARSSLLMFSRSPCPPRARQRTTPRASRRGQHSSPPLHHVGLSQFGALSPPSLPVGRSTSHQSKQHGDHGSVNPVQSACWPKIFEPVAREASIEF